MENASTDHLLWAAVNARRSDADAIIRLAEARSDVGRQSATLLRQGLAQLEARGWTAALAAHALRKFADGDAKSRSFIRT